MNARIPGVDHFILNEAEVTLPRFLEDYQRGRAEPIYVDTDKPDIALTPAAALRSDLAGRLRHDGPPVLEGMPPQLRVLRHHRDVRARAAHERARRSSWRRWTRSTTRGWRGSLFVVDDNFIGNRREVKTLLPKIAAWQRERRYPFALFTEATVSLAEDEPLMDLMVEAGFNMVFLGIETPDRCTLEAMGKTQNLKSDMLSSVRRIQRQGHGGLGRVHPRFR